MSLRRCIQATAVLAVTLGVQALTAGQVFYTDFETGAPPEITGGGSVEGTQGFSGVPGFQTLFFRNTTSSPIFSTALTLTSLPAHNFLNIGFLLAIIDDWDGNALGDTFNVSVDGTTVFSQTYTNYDLDQPYGGTRLTPLGCNCGFGATGDNAYSMSLTVPHTLSSATIELFASGANWADDGNSWAIDNLAVSAEVPEPGTLLLGSGGLAFFGAYVLARRKARRTLRGRS